MKFIQVKTLIDAVRVLEIADNYYHMKSEQYHILSKLIHEWNRHRDIEWFEMSNGQLHILTSLSKKTVEKHRY
jgi:hypothetical protein